MIISIKVHNSNKSWKRIVSIFTYKHLGWPSGERKLATGLVDGAAQIHRQSCGILHCGVRTQAERGDRRRRLLNHRAGCIMVAKRKYIFLLLFSLQHYNNCDSSQGESLRTHGPAVQHFFYNRILPGRADHREGGDAAAHRHHSRRCFRSEGATFSFAQSDDDILLHFSSVISWFYLCWFVIAGQLDQRYYEGPVGGVSGAAGGLHRALLLGSPGDFRLSAVLCVIGWNLQAAHPRISPRHYWTEYGTQQTKIWWPHKIINTTNNNSFSPEMSSLSMWWL